MKILVVGSGGREHALAWKFAQSERVSEVFVAPGNGGTALASNLTNVDIAVMDFDGLSDFAIERGITLTVVGPEAPLVAGIEAHFVALGLQCLAPSAEAAQLEGSKSFTKNFLARYNIPTAQFESFQSVEPAKLFARSLGSPVVIKADGLAAGKGVVVAETIVEADTAIEDMLSKNVFGEAGSTVVVEAFLPGEEASFIVLADGENYLPFATSQDHKAIFDGDQGPNTGGMGAYSPAPVVTDSVAARVCREIIEPTLAGLLAEGIHYTGFLYAGLMIDEAGSPSVIEFNCRFGDPETQPVMMRLSSDLAEVCLAAVEHRLQEQQLVFSDLTALAVVVASKGYPERYETGGVITGLDVDRRSEVFHAGTRLSENGLEVSGGRVLAVAALGESVLTAQQTVYQDLADIAFEGMYFRRDIGYRAIAREVT
ncbi:MAG: phosphoribosylamine--glycine ligase [Pseudomonadales bacterium]|nr:phosphoribosylamine--glycine ligase [Pseudomonadales bacterium]